MPEVGEDIGDGQRCHPQVSPNELFDYSPHPYAHVSSAEQETHPNLSSCPIRHTEMSKSTRQYSSLEEELNSQKEWDVSFPLQKRREHTDVDCNQKGPIEESRDETNDSCSYLCNGLYEPLIPTQVADTRELNKTSPSKKVRMRTPTPRATQRRRDVDVSSDLSESSESTSLAKTTQLDVDTNTDTSKFQQEREDRTQEREDRLLESHDPAVISSTSRPYHRTDIVPLNRPALPEAQKSILKNHSKWKSDSSLLLPPYRTATTITSKPKRPVERRKVRFALNDTDRTYYYISDRLCFPMDTWMDSCSALFHYE